MGRNNNKNHIVFNICGSKHTAILEEKNVGLWDHLPVCVSVLIITFNRLVDFRDIQFRGHSIQGNLDATISNPTALTILIWWALKLLRWIRNFHQSKWNHDVLYAGWSWKDRQILMRLFFGGGEKTKNTNMIGGWMGWAYRLVQGDKKAYKILVQVL
jgi:hypothetical protein